MNLPSDLEVLRTSLLTEEPESGALLKDVNSSKGKGFSGEVCCQNACPADLKKDHCREDSGGKNAHPARASEKDEKVGINEDQHAEVYEGIALSLWSDQSDRSRRSKSCAPSLMSQPHRSLRARSVAPLYINPPSSPSSCGSRSPARSRSRRRRSARSVSRPAPSRSRRKRSRSRSRTPSRSRRRSRTPRRENKASRRSRSRSGAYRSPNRRSPARRSPAHRSPARRSPAHRSPARRSPARRSPARRSPASRSPASRSPAARWSPARRSPARRSPPRRSPPRRFLRSKSLAPSRTNPSRACAPKIFRGFSPPERSRSPSPSHRFRRCKSYAPREYRSKTPPRSKSRARRLRSRTPPQRKSSPSRRSQRSQSRSPSRSHRRSRSRTPPRGKSSVFKRSRRSRSRTPPHRSRPRSPSRNRRSVSRSPSRRRFRASRSRSRTPPRAASRGSRRSRSPRRSKFQPPPRPQSRPRSPSRGRSRGRALARSKSQAPRRSRTRSPPPRSPRWRSRTPARRGRSRAPRARTSRSRSPRAAQPVTRRGRSCAPTSSSTKPRDAADTRARPSSPERELPKKNRKRNTSTNMSSPSWLTSAFTLVGLASLDCQRCEGVGYTILPGSAFALGMAVCECCRGLDGLHRVGLVGLAFWRNSRPRGAVRVLTSKNSSELDAEPAAEAFARRPADRFRYFFLDMNKSTRVMKEDSLRVALGEMAAVMRDRWEGGSAWCTHCLGHGVARRLADDHKVTECTYRVCWCWLCQSDSPYPSLLAKYGVCKIPSINLERAVLQDAKERAPSLEKILEPEMKKRVPSPGKFKITLQGMVDQLVVEEELGLGKNHQPPADSPLAPLVPVPLVRQSVIVSGPAVAAKAEAAAVQPLEAPVLCPEAPGGAHRLPTGGAGADIKRGRPRQPGTLLSSDYIEDILNEPKQGSRMCRACRIHGVSTARRGHKGHCPFVDCQCDLCTMDMSSRASSRLSTSSTPSTCSELSSTASVTPLSPDAVSSASTLLSPEAPSLKPFWKTSPSSPPPLLSPPVPVEPTVHSRPEAPPVLSPRRPLAPMAPPGAPPPLSRSDVGACTGISPLSPRPRPRPALRVEPPVEKLLSYFTSDMNARPEAPPHLSPRRLQHAPIEPSDRDAHHEAHEAAPLLSRPLPPASVELISQGAWPGAPHLSPEMSRPATPPLLSIKQVKSLVFSPPRNPFSNGNDDDIDLTYACLWCGQTFQDEAAADVHALTHAEEDPEPQQQEARCAGVPLAESHVSGQQALPEQIVSLSSFVPDAQREQPARQAALVRPSTARAPVLTSALTMALTIPLAPDSVLTTAITSALTPAQAPAPAPSSAPMSAPPEPSPKRSAVQLFKVTLQDMVDQLVEEELGMGKDHPTSTSASASASASASVPASAPAAAPASAPASASAPVLFPAPALQPAPPLALVSATALQQPLPVALIPKPALRPASSLTLAPKPALQPAPSLALVPAPALQQPTPLALIPKPALRPASSLALAPKPALQPAPSLALVPPPVQQPAPSLALVPKPALQPAPVSVPGLASASAMALAPVRAPDVAVAPVRSPALQCSECPLSFTSRVQQARHRLAAHVFPAEHDCPMCTMKFPTRSRQRIHLARSHRVLQLACPHCGSRFPSRLLLGTHLLVDHPAAVRNLPHPLAISCPVCEEHCLSPGQLTAHVRAFHPGATPMHCAICPRAFNNVSSLLLHHQGHLAAMRRQHCGVCCLWFPTQELVLAHESIEHNPRLFHCPMSRPSCPEVFSSAADLDEHLAAAHTRRRPYTCRCGRRFSSLRDHLQHAEDTLHQAALLPKEGEMLHVCKSCLVVSEDPMRIRDHEDTAHMNLLTLDRVAQLLTLIKDAGVIKNS